MVMDGAGVLLTRYIVPSDSTYRRVQPGRVGSFGLAPSFPLTPTNIAYNGSSWVGRLYDGSGGTTSWNYDIVKIGSSVYVGYVTYTTASVTYDTHTYYLATLTGGSWSSSEI